LLYAAKIITLLPLQKLEELSYLMLKTARLYPIPLDKTLECDRRTDRQTDGQISSGCYSGLHCEQCGRAV